MTPFDNQDKHGDILAEAWPEIEQNQPDVANNVRKIVDGGKLQSVDYYAGFNRALLKMGQMIPELKDPASSHNQIYLVLVAYTEYQIRNT
ncbi:hypothetical protein KY331_05600 [Candidatus Woesearchaeota archaeon]|nr:hypothetical protein [Candidatus Woesearchaeota archaeon]